MIFAATVGGSIALLHILAVLLVAFIIVCFGIVAFFDDNSSKEIKDDMGNTQQVYSDGRKTIESFGHTKRFAILRGVRVDEQGNIQKNNRWFLFDQKENKSIDHDIEGYRRVSPYVYTKGEKGYTKLNFETAEIKQSKDINEFSEEDQEIFKNIEPRYIKPKK